MLTTALISTLLRYILVLAAIAFYTLMERKFLGYFQLRKGPNKPRLIGLPQPFADAIKLFNKEQAKPSISNNILFVAAPIVRLLIAIIIWILYPHYYQGIYIPLGILYFLCISSINVYPTFIAGWSSNSKYALLGSLRGVAQSISYEVRIAIILISILVIIITIDINIIANKQNSWILIILAPIAIIWFITTLAETSRTPFDFAEGESELVSGFNTEYRSGLFAIIFIAEYTNILIIRIISATILCGTIIYNITNINPLILVIKTILFATIFIWVRATLPRIRYDHLIYLAWKTFLPITIGFYIIILSISIII
jgi:NADH-ubiquinone oxidoreductase chain 1